MLKFLWLTLSDFFYFHLMYYAVMKHDAFKNTREM